MPLTCRIRTTLLSLVLTVPLGACQALGPERPDLVGTLWVVTELHGEPFAAPPGRPFYLRLRSDGRFSAYAGCNDLGGSYSRHGATLRVGPFDSLRIICAPPEMAREHALIMAMEGASSYTLESGVLRLHNLLGTTLAGFRRAGADRDAAAL